MKNIIASVFNRLILNTLISFAISFLLFFPSSIYCEDKRGIDLVEKSNQRDFHSGINRALLIGNNNYQSEEWPKLWTAIKDVEKMAEVLVQRYGYKSKNVLILRDATRRDIINAFYQFAEVTKPEDNVLIYYAGHGEFDKQGHGYWIPVEGKEIADYVSNGEILDRIRAIKSKHKFLISDSCFSGNLFTRTRSRVDNLNKNKRLRSGYFIEKSRLTSVQGLSSGGNEPVSDGGSDWDGHSIFAHHLLAVLKANQQKYLSASLLGLKMAEQVANDTSELFGTGEGQTPILRAIKNQGDQGGEFFFVPTDVAAIAHTPVVIILAKDSVNEFVSKLPEVRSIISQAIEKELKKYDIKIVKNIFLDKELSDDEIQNQLEINNAKSALVVWISGKREKKITMMFQGIAYLELNFEVYKYENEKLVKVSELKSEPQVSSIKRWSRKTEQKTKNYIQVAQKTVTTLFRGDSSIETAFSSELDKLLGQLETEE